MPESTPDDSTLKTTLGKGVVLFWKDYEFETGEKKNSLFLILSDCRYNCFLALRPTTKTEFYEKPQSTVARESLVVPKKSEGALREKCALDFTKLKILYFEKIKITWNKEVVKIGSVSDSLLEKIDELVKNSRIVERNRKEWILGSPKKN